MRALEPSQVTIVLRRPDGTVIASNTRVYRAGTLMQIQAADFAGHPLEGGESITVSMLQGSVMAYLTSTDNVTQDSSLQFGN